MLSTSSRTSLWFIPFALSLTILTLPLSVRDPLIMAPILLATTAFSAYAWWMERPQGLLGGFLAAQLALLALLALGMLWLLAA